MPQWFELRKNADDAFDSFKKTAKAANWDDATISTLKEWIHAELVAFDQFTHTFNIDYFS